MYVTTVSIQVQPAHLSEFITASLENHRQSIQEPGNLRFDILQTVEDPAAFTFYEAYETREAAAAHKNTPHYITWRDTVAPWMAAPRTGTAHLALAPLEKSQW